MRVITAITIVLILILVALDWRFVFVLILLGIARAQTSQYVGGDPYEDTLRGFLEDALSEEYSPMSDISVTPVNARIERVPWLVRDDNGAPRYLSLVGINHDKKIALDLVPDKPTITQTRDHNAAQDALRQHGYTTIIVTPNMRRARSYIRKCVRTGHGSGGEHKDKHGGVNYRHSYIKE